jgi:acyl-coenzyme A thioesterase PaaI-like protein
VETSFYVDRGGDRFDSLPTTPSPWGADIQHGGPPAALLTRAVELLPDAAERVIGRFTMELLGPVPVETMTVSATVVRPGRSVALAAAELVAGRPVARVLAWLFPRSRTGAGEVGPPPDHTPDDGQHHPTPPGWHGGYLDAVDLRWVHGAAGLPGPAVVWMRTPAIVAGEGPSPMQRLMAAVDSASGVSSVLDAREWMFLNTDLSVHVVRPPVGEWVCLEAETVLSDGSVGMATANVYDERGLVARSAQALLVVRR